MRLFDLHCDTLTECYAKHTVWADDLERAMVYQPWCQVFAVWLSDTVRGEAAFQYCLDVLAYAKRVERQLSDRFCFVSTRNGLAEAIDQQRTAGLLAVENGSAIVGDPKRVAILSAHGVRVLTLTWNGSNELGNGCLSTDKSGLTDCGKQVLCELEKHHIVADVSHLNEAGFWDVAACATRPFIASHSVSAAVHDHVRNLTNEQFCAVRDIGGLVGLTLCEAQLGAQSFDCLYRHLSQYLSLDGEATVALGFDLDGTAVAPSFNGVQAAARFAEYLLSHGVPEKTVCDVLFENAYRFFLQVLP